MPDADAASNRLLTFVLVDRGHRLAGVRLQQEIGLEEPLELHWTRGVWQVQVHLPDVARMEYLFEIRDRHGHRTAITDPANPSKAPGAFGEKSVLELPNYLPPAWLAVSGVAGDETPLEFDAPELDGVVEVAVWNPAGLDAGAAAPLLVVHDGPEFARLGGLTHYLGVMISAGELPPLRAALLAPGERDAWYSANPAYARAIAELVLPAVEEVAPATVRIGMGASLGALAMLHLHRTHAGCLDGLLLQSGSFFTPDLDPQEAAFSRFDATTAFVMATHGADHDAHPVPTAITCGTVEENLANNKLMAATLARLGYAVETSVVPDAHNYTAWRDALDPHLTALITDVVASHAA